MELSKHHQYLISLVVIFFCSTTLAMPPPPPGPYQSIEGSTVMQGDASIKQAPPMQGLTQNQSRPSWDWGASSEGGSADSRATMPPQTGYRPADDYQYSPNGSR